MSLGYSQDEQMLADTAGEFLAGNSPVSAQRELRDRGEPLGFDAGLWQSMVELGWAAIPFAESEGGLAFGYKGMGALFQALGRHLTATPLLSSVVLCGSLLEQLGSQTIKQQWLAGLMDGERRLALALEEHHRFNPGKMACQAQKTAAGYQLSGTKQLVFDGIGADALLVAALLDCEQALFLVPAQSNGVAIQAQPLIDSRNCATVTLSHVQLPQSARLSAEPDACRCALEQALDLGRVCLAAEMLGASQALLQMTTDYLKTRKQFDVQIGTFQALQHRAAWCFVELELAQSALMGALAAIDSGASAQDRAATIALAKWKAGMAADRITTEAVQMHGGIGVTDELDVGLYLKRIRVAQMALGDRDWLAARYHELTA
ncbi:acyl-CoA dehydrogenase family protein [Shewanella sp. GXUN23E]|uniref:acyl-CoA dehydrogenase family protein n=1 Tax=Shewanella sp. GXUN23E TaxID=3422498 RepID=UPI003D7E2E57